MNELFTAKLDGISYSLPLIDWYKFLAKVTKEQKIPIDTNISVAGIKGRIERNLKLPKKEQQSMEACLGIIEWIYKKQSGVINKKSKKMNHSDLSSISVERYLENNEFLSKRLA